MNQYDRNCLLKRNTSTPWMASLSNETNKCDSTIYCCCSCIDNRCQNLTTTFQSQSNDIWQTRKSYYEEEVVIVLKDGMEHVGFSISTIIPGNHDAIINSILS
ncbi:unnamed protein product, partial [Onchocerca flexuosa]|uniref:PDZ domain-containing protein n=1 Tax=Onchocerca flexuosa TaxID=387005 RepID=A0A183I5P6_9BILA